MPERRRINVPAFLTSIEPTGDFRLSLQCYCCRLERGAGVGRITPALDLDGTIAQRADQERTMTHGLVAVDAQLAE